MKGILRKILRKNLESSLSSPSTRTILIWFLYPELRNSTNKKEASTHFRKICKIIVAFVALLVLSFYFGYRTHFINSLELREILKAKTKTIDSLKFTSLKKDTAIKNLTEVSISRDYWNWKIITETGIKEINAFKKIPDSVFFEALNQCHILNIPHKIFFRIMERESRFQFIHNKTGSGAFGYMQVMPSTFDRWYRKLKLTGGHNQKNNIIVSANLLSSCYKFWKNEKKEAWPWALAEYACGRELLLKSGKIPQELISGIEKVLK